MRKVKAFFHVFTNSLLPNPLYYHKLLKTKFRFSLKYFLFLSITAYIVFFSIYAIKFNYLQNLSLITAGLSKSLTDYPEDLVATIENGKLTTNYDRPYFMWMDFNQDKILLLVIDQNASPSSINNYESISLLTGTEVITRSLFDKNRYVINPYGNSLTVINKANFEEINAIFQKTVLSLFVLIPFLFIFFFPIVVIIINFSYIFSASIITYFISKLWFKNLTFKKNLQISMHAFTFPLIINYGLGLLSFKMIPLTFFVTIILFLSVALYEAHYEENKR